MYGTPLEGVTTSGLVTLTVSDGELSSQEFFEITVTQVNDVPVITSVAPTTATEDIEYTYQVVVEDPDHNSFEFILDNVPEGMSISEIGLIVWTPLEGVLTSGIVTINVSDGEFIASEMFVIIVTQVNDAPVIVSIAPTEVYLDEYYIYEVEVNDPDDDEFTFVLLNALDEMDIDDNGTISWFPTSVGTYGPVTVIVTDDGEDGAVPSIEEFMINVVYNYLVIDFDLSLGNNLVSFYSIPPEDQSIQFVFESLGDNLTHIFGESQLAFNLGDGVWAGSLSELFSDRGYWLRLNEPAELPVYGLPTNNVQYVIHEGANLISYPFELGQNVEDALPLEIQSYIETIYGQSLSAININGNWMGSLESFEGGRGYWIVSNHSFVFEFNIPEGSSLARENLQIVSSDEYAFYQSTAQSFYFVENLELSQDNIELGDWIVAYNNDIVIGSRQWNGEYTDIPVMGYDPTDENTFGYC